MPDDFSTQSLICFAAIAAVVLFGSTLQSAVGFGFGLFCIPTLIWVGLTMPQAIIVVLTGVLFQSGWAAVRLRSDIPWRDVKRSVIVRTFTMLVGIAMMWFMLDHVDKQGIKQILGGVLLAVVIVIWSWKPKPRDRLHDNWGWLAFPLSGFMAGTFGMGGPPLVLWVMAHTWSSRQSRAFLLVNFFITTPVQIITLCITGGGDMFYALLLGTILFPIILMGSQLGLWLGHEISKDRLKHIAYGLLTLLAISSILAPLL